MRLPDIPTDNRYRILVIEDDASIARLVSLHVSMARFECLVARDGTAGWTNFAQWDPHLIITDINMPGLSGHELVEKVRQSSAIPILMMTAADSEDFQMRGFKVGADDYIAKPFNPKIMVARVIANLRRVYRYDSGLSAASAPAADTGAPSMGVAPGYGKCEACAFMAPVRRFESRSGTGDRANYCPNCRGRNILFGV